MIEWRDDRYQVRGLRMSGTVRQDRSVVQVLEGTVLGIETTGIVAIGHGVQVAGRQPEQYAKPLLRLPAMVTEDSAWTVGEGGLRVLGVANVLVGGWAFLRVV